MMGEEELRLEIKKKISELYGFRSSHQEKFVPGKTLIRYCSPIFDDNEVNAAVESLLDGWLGVGKSAAKFEQDFSEYIGLKKTVITNSGTSANLLAVSAAVNNSLIQIDKGDEAITPAMSFPSVINPLLQNGLKPVLVDSKLGTYSVDTEMLEKAVNERTKVLMMPHMVGNPCDMDFLTEFAEEHELILIEDSCDALGSEYRGKKTGTFGHMATYSFYASHHMAMGEGGAVCTNYEELEPVIRSFRDWGRVGAGSYTYNHIGYNLKPIDLQAAMGLVQLHKRLEWFGKKRRENFKFLKTEFMQFEDSFILPEATKNSDPSWFVFPLTIKDGASFTREEIMEFLWKNQIENRSLFAGNIVDQPAYKDQNLKVVGSLKNSEKAMNDSFFIGLYPGMSEEMLKYMVAKFREFMR